MRRLSCFCVPAGTENNFRRSVNSKGVSTYSVDDRKQSAGQYKAALESVGIWVEAKNFLVFQVSTRNSQASGENQATAARSEPVH